MRELFELLGRGIIREMKTSAGRVNLVGGLCVTTVIALAFIPSELEEILAFLKFLFGGPELVEPTPLWDPIIVAVYWLICTFYLGSKESQ